MIASASLLVGKVRRNLDSFGWVVTARKLVIRILINPFYKRTRYRIYRIEAGNRNKAEFNKGLDVAILGPGDDDAIRQVEQQAEWLQGRISDLLANGALCVTVQHDSQVIGFNMVLVGEVFIGEIQWRRTFRPCQAWSEYLWVHSDFRGRGLASQIRNQVYQELRTNGFNTLYGGATLENVASLRSARKSGFKDLVDVDYMKILCFQRRQWTRKAS